MVVHIYLLNESLKVCGPGYVNVTKIKTIKNFIDLKISDFL